VGNFLQQNGIGSLPDQILIPWVKGFKNFWRKGKLPVLRDADYFSLSHKFITGGYGSNLTEYLSFLFIPWLRARLVAIQADHSGRAMAISLPPELQQFADRQIASGNYASLDEILLAGLQALADRERIYQGRFEGLCSKVLLGAEEAERGELLDASTEIEAIRQRLRNRHLGQ
jgi:putative addiction module CopG family antidote